jgi:predicted dehydrogenase
VSGLRFAAVGAGFWARYQLAAWREVPGAACDALCDRDRARAERLAAALGIPAVYTDPDEMLARERPAFVDVITTEETHAPLVHLALRHRVPVICQKPMAPTRALAKAMVAAARAAAIPFLVHENFRFQPAMRAARRAIDDGRIGQPYRGRIQFVSGFCPFINQPNLKTLERFVLMDLGVHLLDLARFLFGEAETIFCTTQKIHPDIRGEDVATVALRMKNGAAVTCELGLAETPVEREHFPETFLFVEGTRGSLEIAGRSILRITTEAGTESRRIAPPRYAWADPDYEVVHASMVACNANLLAGLRGDAPAETTGEDNLKTLDLAFAAYESAAGGTSIRVDQRED